MPSSLTPGNAAQVKHEQTCTHRTAVLHQHCADARRDPAEILLSAQVPFGTDTAQTAAAAAALGAAGAELAIIYLRPPYTATVLEPLARALSGL